MTIINALPYTLTNGTTADATQVMADFNEILNDVNNNAAHNGANNDITSLSGLTTPITPAQGGTTIYYGAGGGTANAQTVPSPTPANFLLVAGYTIAWVPSVSNTGALTLSVNGTTATAVKVATASGLEPCIGGEVVSGQLANATYDGTQWCLDLDPMVGFGTLLNLASATTTDLGTALSHTVNITGTTTITAFGSTASLQRPLYKLTFSGALLLTYNASSLILPGSANITTAAGDTCDALYLGSGNWQVINYARRNGQALAFNPTFIQNYISGLTLSTAGSSGTMSIAAGVAADSTNAQMMVLASAFSKTTASWAAGTGNGGLDTGAIANTTWYHFFEILNPTTGAVDIVFSATATPASGPTTLPSGYTLYRRIGSGKTDGSAHWLAFYQNLDTFLWSAMPALDYNNAAPGTSAITVTLTTPPGVRTESIVNVYGNTGGAVLAILLSSLDVADTAPSQASSPLATLQMGANQANTVQARTWTNTSSSIRARCTSSNQLSIQTVGWVDPRGKT